MRNQSPHSGATLVVWLALVAAACEAESPSDATDAVDAANEIEAPDTAPSGLPEGLCTWTDHAGNPLIEPQSPDILVGDPSVIPPWEAPDDRWHMFANGMLGLYHFVGEDGIAWTEAPPKLFGAGAFRAHVHHDGGDYWLLYEQYLTFTSSEMRIVHSTDLTTWSEPELLLAPELDWEKDRQTRVGNPFLMRRDGAYWLYYSAGGTVQEDTGFAEPRYIGLARAPSLEGPWTKEAQPLLGPSPDTPFRNQGAGSMKLLAEPLGGRWVAFNNGIYEDDAGHSRSAIQVLSSDDGLAWEAACDAPIVAPEGDGWKRAFVYAFDPVWVQDTLRLYYNARDGWAEGIERIGLATTLIPR